MSLTPDIISYHSLLKEKEAWPTFADHVKQDLLVLQLGEAGGQIAHIQGDAGPVGVLLLLQHKPRHAMPPQRVLAGEGGGTQISILKIKAEEL